MEQVARKSFRQVFAEQGGSLACFLGGLAVLTCLLAGVWAFQAHRMDTRWIRTTGTILRLDRVKVSERRGDVYQLTYRLTAPEDKGFVSSLEVDRDTYDAAQVGSRIALLVAPGARWTVAIDSGGTWGIVRNFLCLCGEAVLAGAGFCLYALWRASRMVTVRDKGERLSAKVIAVERVRWWGRYPSWRASWRDEAGRFGRTCVHTSGFAAAGPSRILPLKGATITIYADPKGKLPAVWEGDCGAR